MGVALGFFDAACAALSISCFPSVVDSLMRVTTSTSVFVR